MPHRERKGGCQPPCHLTDMCKLLSRYTHSVLIIPPAGICRLVVAILTGPVHRAVRRLADGVSSTVSRISAVHNAVTVIIDSVAAQANFIQCCRCAGNHVDAHAVVLAALPFTAGCVSADVPVHDGRAGAARILAIRVVGIGQAVAVIVDAVSGAEIPPSAAFAQPMAPLSSCCRM